MVFYPSCGSLRRPFSTGSGRKYEQQWYLPAGRVEKGETLLDAAMRNTVEEAGISVIIKGILG